MGDMFQAPVVAPPDVCMNVWGCQLNPHSFGRGPWLLGLPEAADLAPPSRAGAVGLRLLRGAPQRIGRTSGSSQAG